MASISPRSLAVLPFALALITLPTFAEVGPAGDSPAWTPPEFGTSQMDRITLKTGETLYGDFKALRNRNVVFDSDEFDELKFKSTKVQTAELVSPHTFRLEDRIVTGTAEIRDDVVRVRTIGGEVVEFSRSEIISIIPGGGKESSRWSGDLGMDFSSRRGNTDQIDLSGQISLKRETAETRWIGDYRGVYSKLEGEKNTENHRASSDFDIYVSRNFFATVPSIEYFRDEFQNIEARITPGLALGYEFLKNAMAEWDVSLGGSYQYTAFIQGSSADHDFAVVGSTTLEIDITPDIDLNTTYTVQLIATDLDKTNHHLETEVSNDIWGPVDLDITFIWDRIEQPVADDEGVRPKSDDFRILVGLSVDF